MKVINTIWVNIAGVFITVFLYAVVLNLVSTNISRNLFQVILAAALLILGYGIMFWGLFISVLIGLDLLFFTNSQNNLRAKLMAEWLIISTPFVYWVFKYNEWIFLSAIVAFLITQLLRERKIKDTISKG